MFLCNTDRQNALEGDLLLRGTWNVFVLDTFSGQETWLKSWRNREWTFFPYRFEGCSSLLLRLVPVDLLPYQPRSDIDPDPAKPVASTELE